MARGGDYLGLRTALADGVLPVLVGAMSFLAALALAGALASAALAAQWQGQAAATLTIQVPQPDAPDNSGKSTRLAAVLAALNHAQGVAAPQVMSPQAVTTLLTPWLGSDAGSLGLQLPGIISATWSGPGAPTALDGLVQSVSPGTQISSGALWAARVAAFTGSLQACAVAVLLIVALVATAMVAVAARAGLAQRRDTIAIVHGLGALDGDIAGRFAARATALAFAGALLGTLAALPVLAWLATLAAPFSPPLPGPALFNLPQSLWFALPSLPVAASLIGWTTAQVTVRGWLRNLA